MRFYLWMKKIPDNSNRLKNGHVMSTKNTYNKILWMDLHNLSYIVSITLLLKF